MILRDQLHTAIDCMPVDELTLVYEYIRLLERPKAKKLRPRAKKPLTLQQLHARFAASKAAPGNWSDAVIAGREERL